MCYRFHVVKYSNPDSSSNGFILYNVTIILCFNLNALTRRFGIWKWIENINRKKLIKNKKKTIFFYQNNNSPVEVKKPNSKFFFLFCLFKASWLDLSIPSHYQKYIHLIYIEHKHEQNELMTIPNFISYCFRFQLM